MDCTFRETSQILPPRFSLRKTTNSKSSSLGLCVLRERGNGVITRGCGWDVEKCVLKNIGMKVSFQRRSGRSDPVEKTELGSCDSCGSAIVTGCSYSKIAKILFYCGKDFVGKVTCCSQFLASN
ncbi:hypothetical protein TNCT_168861 [Trichonephila clavata]|uniref:Uncharacterized protein n=1 Tax=Trichonephila clavata TaxID=2740835 RepID=A0A8X6HT76_TRICU|nr:hypothetical protein TNCT_168861 [Trichonephila clavata]